jgi:hypothetical protein
VFLRQPPPDSGSLVLASSAGGHLRGCRTSPKGYHRAIQVWLGTRLGWSSRGRIRLRQRLRPGRGRSLCNSTCASPATRPAPDSWQQPGVSTDSPMSPHTFREAVVQFIADIANGGQSFHPGWPCDLRVRRRGSTRRGTCNLAAYRHALWIPPAMTGIGDSPDAIRPRPAARARRKAAQSGST